MDLGAYQCRLAFTIPSSKRKAPDLLGEVGFGRRARGNAYW